MSVSFSQPVRIYKFNNSTNNGVIAPDNTGAAAVTQQAYITNPISAIDASPTNFTTAALGQTTPTPFTLPAGAIISNVRLYQTGTISAITGGVITVSINITNPSTGAVTTTALGTITPTATGGLEAITFNATSAVAALLANVGPVDAYLTFQAAAVSAITGTLGGTFDVSYTARNNDGSITQVGSGYTNN
jgi:hypothetical protein